MASIANHPSSSQVQSNSVRDIPCVESSFLENFRYDASTFQLTVTMKSGAQYVHFYVYPMVIDQLIASPSKGKFYAENIKGKTPGNKVTHKEIGPAVRNPLKGPVSHVRKQPVHYKAA